MEKKRHDDDDVHLSILEDGWFFGNTLISRSKPSSSSMVRCNSDPCPSNKTNLARTPSLPVYFSKDAKYELLDDHDEEDDDEPRMGDLIRQAMPVPVPVPRRRLQRSPSLPQCRGTTNKDVSTTATTTTKPYSQSNLKSTNMSGSGIESPKVTIQPLQEKGPIASMTKLTRRASMDSSMFLPPKYSSKGTRQNTNHSKSRSQRKMEPSNLSITPVKTQNLDKSKSQKSLSDLEIQELQGLKDLGFSFDNNDLSPSVTQIVPALQRRASLGSNFQEEVSKLRRPYLSEAWQNQSSPGSGPPLPASPSAKQDMKAQIKFWARAVASNVRQEC